MYFIKPAVLGFISFCGFSSAFEPLFLNNVPETQLDVVPPVGSSVGFIDIGEYESNGHDEAFKSYSVEKDVDLKRTDVHVCRGNNAYKCEGTEVDAEAAAESIAGIAYLNSRNRDCRRGIYQYDKFYFSYKATGKNCNTSARFETLKGAIKDYIQFEMTHQVCQFTCIAMNHEGSWNGYVGIGTNLGLVQYTDCGPESGPFRSCTQCGDKC
ncbi:uncharacterized protein Ecym_3623 [Eremothecium cymbalariae DBVPG|uniref:Secreted protein CSS2 C-terminal domain-containing protein n=1 Tax=Eremothecium cymbalariae (strain CBS 270.75 / DBVPG 7215 / KCTC 17166 / NRRL Y-17582) TaxID=931890 RepID=G8JQV0_ERECY|nr:Hypothetical protein Ecym_3623 [Eremothecium cymbalariae DBVPG\